jgi:carbonic anhydrase
MLFDFHRCEAAFAGRLLTAAMVCSVMSLSAPVLASTTKDDADAAPSKAVTSKKTTKPAEEDLTAKTISAATAAAAAADLGDPVPRATARDPMDIIRERLAARLGAARVPAAAPGGSVKVVSNDPAGVKPAPRAKAAPTRVAALSPGLADPTLVLGANAAGSPRGAVNARAGSSHWSYEGDNGPAAWAQLKPEFATCGSGSRQSPIDIRDGIKVELDAVQFDYRPSGFRVVDNGHTVQVNVAAGNTIEVAGKRYELVEFHFHRPSEERIDGKPFDMVVHLVHKSVDGRVAMVAVLLDKGSAQPVVQMVWNNLPLEKGDEVAARTPLDLNALLPTDRRYYTYMGSLTEPPCSEGVLWMVMKTPVEVSPEQIAIFSRLYPMNARPIQSASGRMIKESN